MASIKSISIDDMLANGSIGEADVLRLRSACYEAGGISAADADALLSLDAECSSKARTWAGFVVEAVSDYVVTQAEPEGYVSSENAAWLMARINHDGSIASRTELELLVTILDRARWSPEGLVRFALAQVRDAVISGSGPLRGDGPLKPGEIAEAEVELLRRILYAFGGDGNIAVTEGEADILFEINDATADVAPNAAWTDLFVKAIANAVMSASAYSVPTREEALRREAWLASSHDVSLLDLLKSVTELPRILTGYKKQTREETALARLERQRVEMIVNERITASEARWLAERIGRDGKVTANEAALIAYLQNESPALHPELMALVSRLAQAA